MLNPSQAAYLAYCRANNINFADARRHIPHPSSSVAVVYASHMLEHLDRRDADAFLVEAYRVLEPGGVLRLAVPDLHRYITKYTETHDADALIHGMHTCVDRPRSLLGRLRAALIGPRHHQWMYDAQSLCALLQKHGFADVRALEAGNTGISDPGALNLHERADESLYVEGRKP
jgi:predicted SAM-dependent methyltransferase